MINAALNLVPNAVGQGRPQIIGAIVADSTPQTPLPAAFTDPLFVVNPAQPESFWRVDEWTVDHGGTLPQAGAACGLFYDSKGALRALFWEGAYTAPAPGGAAGGVLSGTFPNPGMASGAAATNVGTLAGALGGTLPNPSLSASTLQTFLQLASAGIVAAAFGTTTVTFSASQTSAGTTVTHGLGRVPQAILATPQQVVGATGIVPYVSVLTSSQFTLAAWVSVVVTTTTTCSWIAIG